ncbi:MAG TPA: DUF4124 domain-containing protein [Methylophilaceae bacterium]|nr:DUF4124 domain-containing protein [Methylophilaceae bacterium]
MLRVITLTFSLLLAFSASAAAAGVYKCQSQSGKVIYSDVPCKSGTQTLTDIPVTTPDSAVTTSSSTMLTRQMDAAVKSAIANNDLQRAQALASTPQHWAWIAEARQQADQATTTGRTEADLSAEKGNSQACQQAMRSYELEADSSFDEPGRLAAKRSLMHAACGIQDTPEAYSEPPPVTAFYPAPLRPYYRPRLTHRHWPGWGSKPPNAAKPKPEPPAVSVIVGPAK